MLALIALLFSLLSVVVPVLINIITAHFLIKYIDKLNSYVFSFIAFLAFSTGVVFLLILPDLLNKLAVFFDHLPLY